MYYKCCVPGCTSLRQDALLHKFPLCKKRLEKWLETIPDDSLRNRKSDFAHLQICHKHFEIRFVTSKKRLKITAYPSLFQESEIKSGIPLNSLESGVYDEASIDNLSGRKLHYDHTYSTAVFESPIEHINTGQDDDEEEESVQQEVAILCNNCQNVILGFRYKCVTCENYNLCKKCEMMEVHDEHYMLRIPKPLKCKEATDIAQKLKQIFTPESEVAPATEEDPIGVTTTLNVSTDDETTDVNVSGEILLSKKFKNIIQNEVSRVLDQRKETSEPPSTLSRKRRRKVDMVEEVVEVCDEKRECHVVTEVNNAAPEMVLIVNPASGFDTQESSIELAQEMYDESELISEDELVSEDDVDEDENNL